ncbi:MAG TPA: hypothetical protein VMH39_01845, partial [Gemmatimonadaceae bacterium]|nr:hypothetical protein [Gemmatimonadaceae bacterium]
MPAQTLPPIRQLPLSHSTVRDSFSSTISIRPLSDGRVMIGDGGGHRLLLFDSTLRRATVVLDTASTAARRFPSGRFALIAGASDTTLFVDRNALALVVIAPDGSIVRTVSVPVPATLMAQLDDKGVLDPNLGLVLEGNESFAQTRGDTTNPPIIPVPDSAPILRINLLSRRIDTIAFIRLPNAFRWTHYRLPNGSFQNVQTDDPFPYTDLWAMLSDGT